VERKSASLLEFNLTEEGDVRAAFARTGVVDFDKDYTFPGAFPVKELPISAYGHKSWPERGGMLPVGKGSIKEVGDLAILDGHFFVDTTHGRDTYLTVKGMGGLQEWSYGFDVTATAKPPEGIKARRGIKALDVIEVSPVMLGAGIGTHTQAIKGTKSAADMVDQATSALRIIHSLLTAEAADAADPDEDPADAAEDADDLATLRDAADSILEYIASTSQEVGSADDVEDAATAAPYPMVGMAQRDLVAAIKGQLPAGMTFADASARLLRQANGLSKRLEAIQTMRLKEGRKISAARAAMLRDHVTSFRKLATELEAMLDAALPADPGSVDGAKAMNLRRAALWAMARSAELSSASTRH
jgi:hypothetical protein